MVDLYDRSRRAEDDYFRRKDAELIEAGAAPTASGKTPIDAAGEFELRILGDALGVHERDLIVPLHAAGLRAASAVLIEWLPAIEVAWIDDVDLAEREELRRQFAADPQSSGPALALLTEWLFVRPPLEAMVAARRVMRRRLDASDADNRRVMLGRIVSRCEAVGCASGGFFGLGAMSWDEQARIDVIRESLGDDLSPPAEAIEIPH